MTSRLVLQRVTTAILAIATAALCLVAATSPAAADGSVSYSFKAAGSSGATQGTGFYRGPVGDGVVNPYEYGYVPMCMNNAAPGDMDSDVMCNGAATYCAATGQGTGIALRVWRRLPGAAWNGTGVVYCPSPAHPTTFIPIAKATEGIEEQVRRHTYDATGAHTIAVTQHWDIRIEPFALAGLTIDAPDQPSACTVQIDELHNEIGAPQ